MLSLVFSALVKTHTLPKYSQSSLMKQYTGTKQTLREFPLQRVALLHHLTQAVKNQYQCNQNVCTSLIIVPYLL